MSTVLPSPVDPFAELNPAQQDAVRHGLGDQASDTRPLLVIAGAGSGKTNTLAHRVANLILHGADPQRILLLTFSRRAAVEMERRVASVVGRVLKASGATSSFAARLPTAPVPALPWSGTFHSVGARLLREYALRIGLDEAFTIHDRSDSEDLLGLVRHDLNLSATKNRFPQKGTCLAIYSRVVNTQGSLAEVLASTFTWCAAWESELKTLFRSYVEAKQTQNVLDYDDLLLCWAEMASEPVLAAELGQRFDHVLVDEYQDTNRLQAAILLGMKPDGAGVTVVGDDAQSIYAFRGATVRNILDFPHQFGQTGQAGPIGQVARVVTLERNYRSTQPILEASNAVIAQARERHAKTLWTDKMSSTKPQLVLVPDEADEARWVANQILAHREAGLRLKSQAVLFRTSSHSAAVELELTRRGIPFVKFGGLKFLEATHVKDMLAILRFAQNPRGRLAGMRVTQLIPGIGAVTATRLLDAMAQSTHPQAVLDTFEPPGGAKLEWQAFATLYRSLRHPQLAWPADMALAKQWYLPHLERLHDDADARRADIENQERMASGYASAERFLTDLTLDPPDATSDQSGVPSRDEDYTTLSTIHSAKGQEWKAVFVLRAVDGCIPSDMATGHSADIEEERRLLYVAMTRARDYLHVMQPHRFYVTQQRTSGDRHVYALRTRFITAAMLPGFERISWPSAPPGTPGSTQATGAVMQVRDRVRAAWR
ncbi:ATP-dependent helicase [Rhodoferax sp. WC2427]|uniref:ATP-dependent helicase n=1 Tax=Rhodoferax sp. WC2427 TaxID=3234144 RepID=UPI003466FC90